MSKIETAHQKFLAALAGCTKKPYRIEDAALDACMATIRYLEATDASRDQLIPMYLALYLMLRVCESKNYSKVYGTKPGRRPRPYEKMLALATASAAITIIKKTHVCTISEATSYVSKAAGIEKRDLKNFRDAISRGKASNQSRNDYREQVKKLCTLSSSDLVDAIKNAGALYGLSKKINVPNPGF